MRVINDHSTSFRPVARFQGTKVSTSILPTPQDTRAAQGDRVSFGSNRVTFGNGLGLYDHNANQTIHNFSNGETVNTNGWIHASECANVGNLIAGKEVTAEECNVFGDVQSKKSYVDFRNGNVSGRIEAEGNVAAAYCERIGSVEAGDRVDLNEVHVTGKPEEETPGNVKSRKSTAKVVGSIVDGEVSAPLGVQLVDSQAEKIRSGRQASLTSSTVKKDMHVVSGAQIVDSDVNGNIYVAPPLSRSEKEIVRIEGDSTVEGDITFTSGKGKVVLVGDAQFNGQVIGGELEYGT